jgi:metal-dependent amidase/aminoacylase/carboxypeptidase family protein
MKFLPLLAFGLLIATVTCMDKDEAKEMFRNMSQECKEQEKATDADVETMVNENYPDSKEGKCLVACMQETFGIVSETN